MKTFRCFKIIGNAYKLLKSNKMLQKLQNQNKCHEIYEIHETATKSFKFYEIVIQRSDQLKLFKLFTITQCYKIVEIKRNYIN